MKSKFFLGSLGKTVLAAAISLTAIGVANANNNFTNALADPFINQTVDLETPTDSLVAFPGVGPGGSTLYASNFIIDDFTLSSIITDGQGDEIETYAAVFNVGYLWANGAPFIISGAGVQAGATLAGDFVVDYTNSTSPFETGTFNLTLLEASFSGVSNLGAPLYIKLGNTPSATVSISQTGLGYNIGYQSFFGVQGMMSVDNINFETANLIDANVQPMPEPATLALLVSGLLGFAGLRRRA